MIERDASHINWPSEPYRKEEGLDRWEGRITAIAPGGMPYGAKTAVFHVARTDVDADEDVPSFDFPKDEDVTSESWEIEHKGEKLYRIQGELWRNEWIEPTPTSPIIRGDRGDPGVAFVVDASGARKSEHASEEADGFGFDPT
ncbi:MAG: hypothetical protein IPK20_22420 [Betaproteobacteria bacterium]|nr:hypothetical protein [Betaproteobacteria bacterium]